MKSVNLEDGNITDLGNKSFTYDYRNLVTVASEGENTRYYWYDAAGNRVKEFVDEQTMHYYIYDGAKIIAEYTGSALTARYVYGNGWILKIDQNGYKWYYMTDHLGSRRVLYSSQGEIGDDYYPFGEVMEHQGSNPDAYKFTGQRRDESLDVDHFYARDYIGETGRFLGVDPIMEYYNPYTYVGNHPMNFVDPLGMDMKRKPRGDYEGDGGGSSAGWDPGYLGGDWRDGYVHDNVFNFCGWGVDNWDYGWQQTYNPSIGSPPGWSRSGGSDRYLSENPGGGSGGYWKKVKQKRWRRKENPDLGPNPLVVVMQMEEYEVEVLEWIAINRLERQEKLATGLAGLGEMIAPMSAFWSTSSNLKPLGQFAGRAGTAFGIFAWAANSAYLGNKYGYGNITSRYEWQFNTWSTGVGIAAGATAGILFVNPWIGYAAGFTASQLTGMIVNVVYDKPWRNNTLLDPRIW